MAATVPAVSRYEELTARYPLRPIRSEEGYDAAVVVMNALLDHDRNEDEEDYLHVLGFLIGEYDKEHHALPASTPADVLRDLMDEQGLSQAELAAATGIAAPNISAMLANKRGISKASCRAFALFFGVPADRFLVETA